MSVAEFVRISDLARPKFKANPYPFYQRLREEAPVCRTRFLGRRAWLVTRYDDSLKVLKDERLTKDTSWARWIHFVGGSITRHMLNADGADHERLRRLVNKAFAPNLVERLHGRIQEKCNELLDALESDRDGDLIRSYALPLPLTIITDLLGMPEKNRGRFHRRSRSSLSPSTIAGVFRAVPDQRFLIGQIRKVVEQRREEPRDDLITALARAEESGDKLNQNELVATIFLLIIAGYETTVNLIGSGALALMENASERQRLIDNSALEDTAVEELLRYTSPLDIATQRFAGEELTLGSTKVSRGDAVFVVLGSANRDESQFPEPHALCLARDPNKHLAFGNGAHFCLGAALARLEARIALTMLFRRFPELHVRSPEALRWRKSLIVRGLAHLPVAF
jgi:cytochrome P450